MRVRRRNAACAGERSGRSTRPSATMTTARAPAPAECGGRALSPRAAHVGVVEQHRAAAADCPTRGRGHLEGAAVGPHVTHGRTGTGEHLRRPSHAGNAGDDDTGQTLDSVERRPTGSCGRRDGQREFERATGGRGEAAGVSPKEAADQRAHHRREAAAGLADGRLLVAEQHGVERAGQWAQAHREHRREGDAEAAAHPAAGEAHAVAARRRAAADQAHPGSGRRHAMVIRRRGPGRALRRVDAGERSPLPG